MQLVVTKSNTLNAFSWIKQGWRLFTLKPGAFMGMSGIVLGVTLLANMIPLLGIVLVLIAPFLTAGFYRAASLVEQGESITVSEIFALFSDLAKYRVMFRLAAIALLVSVPISMLATNVATNINDGLQPEFFDILTLVVLMAVNFMAFAFSIPAAWVAPQTPALQLIKQSLQACWINVLPLTIYGLLIMMVTLISAPVILLGWLIAYSISVLSFYQMFMTIYQPESTTTTGDFASEAATVETASSEEQAPTKAQESSEPQASTSAPASTQQSEASTQQAPSEEEQNKRENKDEL